MTREYRAGVILPGVLAILAVLGSARLPIIAPWPLMAQSAGTSTDAFEAASVKLNRSGGPVAAFPLPGGRYHATNMTLRAPIRSAYGLRDLEIVRGPNWLEVDRFDITARADPSTSWDEMRVMLRALLVERFRLATHARETERPIYALMLARSDGRLGPRLRPAGDECAPTTPPRGVPAASPLPPPGLASTGTGQVSCPSVFGLGHISARRVTMSDLASVLSNVADRLVVDRTALGGPFDADLDYAPDVGLRPGGDLRFPAADFAVGDAPSLFTALREQFGLRLEGRPSTDHRAWSARAEVVGPSPVPPTTPGSRPPTGVARLTTHVVDLSTVIGGQRWGDRS